MRKRNDVIIKNSYDYDLMLSKERELNKLYTSYALFLATLERRAPKAFFGPKLFFDKN